MAKHTPGFLKLAEDARTRIRETNVQDIKARLDRGDKFLLLDVREDHEWAAGHLPHAAHLGRGVIERDMETKYPDFGTEVIVYCGGGYRSAMAADNLQKMGYTNVVSMDGGFRGWKDAGFPVEQG